MATEMEFGLLGPLTVRADGATVLVPQGKQRILLAALLLNAGRVLSLDELADALWDGGGLPEKWRVTLQNYVRRLRRALGDEGGTRIVTHPNGYAITVSTAELDVARFKAGLAASRVAARDGSWETAAIQARAALSLWRGAPLDDVGSERLRDRHEPQLEDIRLQLLETRIDAELRLGYSAQLVGELRQLTRDHPIREHLWAQLTLALYRDGRQAEALAAYAEARELLVERLGVDPGPEMRDLHQRMLAADPALILPTAPGGAMSATESATERDPRQAPSPYLGLAAFSEADAELFFGREQAAAQVLGRLAAAFTDPGVVVVSGVSGAGKSSLLRAGVLAQLRHFGLPAAPEAASWPRVVFSPGSDPLGELAVRFAPLAGLDAAALRDRLAADPSGFALTARQAMAGSDDAEVRRVVIVADQCEQLFTVCESPAEREAFVTALHATATGPHPAALVVLVVRADFEARLADFPELSAAVQDRYLLTAMTARQLRLAITRPAASMGTQVDEDLIRILLDEVRAAAGTGETSGSGGHGGAGVLPLLSHALDQTWRNGTGPTLTLTDYERTGGIEGAVAATAQRAYDSLTPPQQGAARQIFTRLTTTGDDGTDTAARILRADLAGDDVAAVLERFAAERLLTLATDTVEITHEALLTAWPLLRDTWLADARADRVIMTRLHATAAEWDQANRDPSYLYAGSRLDTVESATARIDPDLRPAPLSGSGREFIHASRRAARHRVRIRQQVIAVLLALVTGLTAVFIAAVRADQAATGERDIVATQRDIAASDLLASESKASSQSNVSASNLEALAAWALDPSGQNRANLLGAAASPATATITTDAEGVATLAISPNGQVLATGSDEGPLQLWNMANGQEIDGPLDAASSSRNVLGFSADGRTLVTYADAVLAGNLSGVAQRWDVATGKPAGPSVPGLVSGRGLTIPLLSPDGTTLATTDAGGTVRLWAMATGRPINGPLTVGWPLAFSPDGKILAIAASPPDLSKTTVTLWNVASGDQISTLRPAISGPAGTAAFSPDGKTLAIASGLATAEGKGATYSSPVWLWSVASGKRVRTLPVTLSANTGINAIAYSPHGAVVAVAGGSTVQLWDPITGQLTGGPLGNGSIVNAIAFSPDGETLVTGGDDGTARLWDVTAASFQQVDGPGGLGNTAYAAFRAGGRTLVTYTSEAQVRDVDTGHADPPFATADGISDAFAAVNTSNGTAVALSPDGRILATDTGNIQLWNTATGHEIGSPIGVGSLDIWLAFSPDGKTLATADGAHPVELWDIASGRPAGKPLPGSAGAIWVAFAPDGDLLSLRSAYGPLSVWNLTTGKMVGRPVAAHFGPILWEALSPDGKTMVLADDGGVAHAWNIATGQELSSMSGGSGFGSGAGGSYNSVAGYTSAFSPDGDVLAVADASGVVRLWDVATGQQLSSLAGSDGAGVAYSPDGTKLAVVDQDGAEQLWNLSALADPLKTLCQRIGGTLTPQEWAQYVPPGPGYRDPCAAAA